MTQVAQSIIYFEREGRENLPQVIRVVKRYLRKRGDLRSCKIVVFTAIGEGPAMAYNMLQEYDPVIIAVTFPLDFSARVEDKIIKPRIPDKVQDLFKGLKIQVITSRLPFDAIDGVPVYNEQMGLIRDVITLFGGSFAQSLQSVLQACDHGAVTVGEKVISITGDSACVITASTTKAFLTKEAGLQVNEILCKSRNLTIARGEQAPTLQQTPLFAMNASKPAKIKELHNAQIVETKETK